MVDHSAQKVIQVTSTTTKQKIDNSLKILKNPKVQRLQSRNIILARKTNNVQSEVY
ncbi:hypothetical protein ACT691_13595 [Vibrio metschnikovii]